MSMIEITTEVNKSSYRSENNRCTESASRTKIARFLSSDRCKEGGDA